MLRGTQALPGEFQGISNAISIGICLSRVGYLRTVISRISYSVIVGIGEGITGIPNTIEPKPDRLTSDGKN